MAHPTALSSSTESSYPIYTPTYSSSSAESSYPIHIPTSGTTVIVESTDETPNYPVPEEQTAMKDGYADSYSSSDSWDTEDNLMTAYIAIASIKRGPCIPHPFSRSQSDLFHSEDSFYRCCSCRVLDSTKKLVVLKETLGCPCGHDLGNCENQLSDECGTRCLGWICWACDTANPYVFDEFQDEIFMPWMADKSVEQCTKCGYRRDGACPLALVRFFCSVDSDYVWSEWF